ncbi:hypothetical protein G6F66_015480 [Rhizopus arrhizus]|nr:hypothetical protein G6F66_015480 [Rhizopus arrhizus]
MASAAVNTNTFPIRCRRCCSSCAPPCIRNWGRSRTAGTGSWASMCSIPPTTPPFCSAAMTPANAVPRP